MCDELFHTFCVFLKSHKDKRSFQFCSVWNVDHNEESKVGVDDAEPPPQEHKEGEGVVSAFLALLCNMDILKHGAGPPPLVCVKRVNKNKNK